MLYALNDTAIVTLRSQDAYLSTHTAVQVTVKASGHVPTDDLAAFFHAQRELSDLVTCVITAHLQHPLPSPMRFDGEGYILTAKHAEWTFGRDRVKFSWGTEEILPGKDKWTFSFAAWKRG